MGVYFAHTDSARQDLTCVWHCPRQPARIAMEGSYLMLRHTASGLDRVSEPDFDRILAGKPQHGPSGRPSAGRKADFEVFPSGVRPISSPEVRFQAGKHYCLTSGITKTSLVSGQRYNNIRNQYDTTQHVPACFVLLVFVRI